MAKRKRQRRSWSVENRLHYVKDVSMNEDRYRTGGGFGRITTAIRSIASRILQAFGTTTPVAAMRSAAWPSLLLALMTCKSLVGFKMRL